MAASSGVAQPINFYRLNGSGTGTAIIRDFAEAATQTFLQGTPVQFNGGYIRACAAITSVATALIAGISNVAGANLTTNGVAKTLTTSYQPPNQPNAVVIPFGAPPNDGTTIFNLVSGQQSFKGIFGDSATAANAVLALTQIGSIFGLTKDAGNNFWYVDNNITTTAGGACVQIVSLIDPVGTLNGYVEFKVLSAANQL